MDAKDRLVVALDTQDWSHAKDLMGDLIGLVGYFKIGLELITRIGVPEILRETKARSARVFLDNKFHDIPNTIRGAVKSLAPLEPAWFDLHASGGVEAIAAAVAEKGKMKLLAVTVLTSLSEADCESIFGDGCHQKVLQFAKMAKQAGADGVVCSAQEASLLAEQPMFADFMRVTPGIRPLWAGEKGDQKRVVTPRDAIRKGATHLVVGRPILAPPKEVGSPKAAAERIVEEIAHALE